VPKAPLSAARVLLVAATVWALAAVGSAHQVRWQVEPSAADFDRWVAGTWDPSASPRLSARDFRRVTTDLKSHGVQWIQAAGPGAESGRRLQVATFVLDFLLTQDIAFTWLPGSPVLEFFNWARDLVGQGPPTEAEKRWYLASVGLLHRCGVPLGWFSQIALARFPNEPRFLLARALAEEQQTWPQARHEQFLTPDPKLWVHIQSRFRPLFTVPGVGAEAQIRLGHLELRRGQVAAALGLFESAGEPADPFLRYLRALFIGQAHTQQSDVAAAATAYEAAFAAVPWAQSATLAWASTLLRLGRGAEAARLADELLTLHLPVPDPWQDFVHSEWRHFDTDLAILRGLVRP
jgi:tetratricopeptide (TPR) repeat protein